MALQIINALDSSTESIDVLRQHLPQDGEGFLYLGFPLVQSAGGVIPVDAVLLSDKYGFSAFRCFDHIAAADDDANKAIDEIYIALKQRLEKNPKLRNRRELSFQINVYNFVAETASAHGEEVVDPYNLVNVLGGHQPIERALLPEIQSTLESLITLKPTSRRQVAKANSLGARLKIIDDSIRTLDEAQRRATIQMRNGPERIRGLAGSGKTIVLALRASLMHVRHPEWQIAVTFYTRSLYQQFKALIERFCYSYDTEPDWTKLRLLHSWGGRSKAGYYSTISDMLGIAPMTFDAATSKPGDAFSNACSALIPEIQKAGGRAELFDAVLVDEAQDFAQPFFELIYLTTKEPKRIVYAYDELQNLSDQQMLPPDELFGRSPDGSANISLASTRDTTLPVCYRNTPQALVTAHALGFGIYREGEPGLVQMFPDKGLWSAVGYEVIAGDFQPGQMVDLARDPDATPRVMAEVFDGGPTVIRAECFSHELTQAKKCAREIKRLLSEEEIEEQDILIVFPYARTARSDSAYLIRALAAEDIAAHLVGVDSPGDIVFRESSIAITSSYRAKGNEAPVVFVLNAERCAENFELAKARNMLFTAITRSKAIVYIYGLGDRMTKLMGEISKVKENDYHLVFKVPTDDELRLLRQLYRDRTTEQIEGLELGRTASTNLMELIKKGAIEPEDMSLLMSEADLEQLRHFIERHNGDGKNG